MPKIQHDYWLPFSVYDVVQSISYNKQYRFGNSRTRLQTAYRLNNRIEERIGNPIYVSYNVYFFQKKLNESKRNGMLLFIQHAATIDFD